MVVRCQPIVLICLNTESDVFSVNSVESIFLHLTQHIRVNRRVLIRSKAFLLCWRFIRRFKPLVRHDLLKTVAQVWIWHQDVLN